MSGRVSLASLAALALALAGCGSHASISQPRTLPATAVPYLPSSVKALTAAALAREAGAPTLSGALGGWGYLVGTDRYFQGESRKLQVVDSRTLRFKTAAGAQRFVSFIRTHTTPYLGSFARAHSFTSRGRSGILLTAQQCQCHLASPAYLAVLARAGTVTWLEINGPGATARKLAELIALAP